MTGVDEPGYLDTPGTGRTAYRTVEPDGNAGPVEFAFLHGAGTASMSRVTGVAADLAAEGYRSILFDAFGHGLSSGRLADQSLAVRADQAERTVNVLARGPVVLVGFSMGGHVAADLVNRGSVPVAGVALCAPAAYTPSVERTRFGHGFTDAIRVEGSWRDAASYRWIGGFDGPVLLCTPEFDDVVPRGVTDGYRSALSVNRLATSLDVVAAGHQLGSWFAAHDDARASFVEALVRLARAAVASPGGR